MMEYGAKSEMVARKFRAAALRVNGDMAVAVSLAGEQVDISARATNSTTTDVLCTIHISPLESTTLATAVGVATVEFSAKNKLPPATVKGILEGILCCAQDFGYRGLQLEARGVLTAESLAISANQYGFQRTARDLFINYRIHDRSFEGTDVR